MSSLSAKCLKHAIIAEERLYVSWLVKLHLLLDAFVCNNAGHARPGKIDYIIVREAMATHQVRAKTIYKAEDLHRNLVPIIGLGDRVTNGRRVAPL